MLATSFPIIMPHLLAHEGGYIDHSEDPGGPTNFGITLATYRRHINWAGTADDVKAMKIADARKVYRGEYWAAIRADELPAGVDYALFDYAVNSGVGRAGKVLRRVVGIKADTSVVTGDVIAAVDKRDPKALINAISDERLAFLKSLKTWPSFGVGWGRRVREVRALALAMAGEPQAAPVIVTEDDRGKGEVAPAPVGPVVKGGTAATAGSSAWAWLQSPEAAAALVIGGFVVTVVTVVVLHRLRKQRQETPMDVKPVEVWR